MTDSVEPDHVDAGAWYEARDWQQAFDGYAQADGAARDALSPADLERYAVAAHLLGRFDDYFQLREREFHERVDRGDPLGAARAAWWIGSSRVVIGDVGAGSGWLARARRLVDEHGRDCVERGYIVAGDGLVAWAAGDFERATVLLDEAVATALRFDDPELTVLALHQSGLALLSAGDVPEGLAHLDEAMVCLSDGVPSPMVTGIVYCGVIKGCWDVYELRRAQEWTAAMTTWCASQTSLAIFTGECRVRRAELKQLHGAWVEAHEEVAGVDYADADAWAAAAAAYVRGNLDRLRGRYDAADEAFRQVAQLGNEPQPGLALLRLAQGSRQAAAAMVRRALAAVGDPSRRVELLSAATEIFLGIDESDAARSCVRELDDLARRHASPVTEAIADQAYAEVAIHDGDTTSALEPLRSGLGSWVKLRAPYQEARVRALLAGCCRTLGDHESADREFATARAIFERLGAVPDLARLDAAVAADRGDGPLTGREVEVLRLVATGATNKAIAAELVLSERTVDRHVSNIFVKLGISTRAAATAYAFERRLL